VGATGFDRGRLLMPRLVRRCRIHYLYGHLQLFLIELQLHNRSIVAGEVSELYGIE
jgi:hypothetical protein